MGGGKEIGCVGYPTASYKTGLVFEPILWILWTESRYNAAAQKAFCLLDLGRQCSNLMVEQLFSFLPHVRCLTVGQLHQTVQQCSTECF